MREETITVTITSDLSGKPDAETVEFSYGGKAYEVDLTASEKAAFDKAVAKYVKAATPVKAAATTGRRKPTRKTGGTGGRPGATPAGVDPAAVREWARSQGIDIGDRGRLSKQLVADYQAAKKRR